MADINPLGELIDIARRANGWSDEDVAERARRRDEKLVKSTISEIRRNGLKTITPGVIRGLAAGLDLPVGQVLRAALQTLGLDAGPEADLVDAIRSDPYLPAFAKRQMIATVEMARAEAAEIAEMGEDGHGEQEPQSNEGSTPSSSKGQSRGRRGTPIADLPNAAEARKAKADRKQASKDPMTPAERLAAGIPLDVSLAAQKRTPGASKDRDEVEGDR